MPPPNLHIYPFILICPPTRLSSAGNSLPLVYLRRAAPSERAPAAQSRAKQADAQCSLMVFGNCAKKGSQTLGGKCSQRRPEGEHKIFILSSTSFPSPPLTHKRCRGSDAGNSCPLDGAIWAHFVRLHQCRRIQLQIELSAAGAGQDSFLLPQNGEHESLSAVGSHTNTRTNETVCLLLVARDFRPNEAGSN